MVLDDNLVVAPLVIVSKIMVVYRRSFYFRGSEAEKVDVLVVADFYFLIISQSLGAENLGRLPPSHWEGGQLSHHTARLLWV
jgi:hypothetical protein